MVAAHGGFSGTVNFTVSGLPAGATGTFSPATITGSGSSTLTINTLSSTTLGTYPLTLTATSGSLTHTVNLTLVVIGPANFSVSATPSVAPVNPGSNANYNVAIAGQNGFSGTVNFSVSGLPANTAGLFSPTTVTGSGSTTLSISTQASVIPGSYPLTITATSGSLTHTTSVTLAVAGAADFALAATPGSRTIVAGSGTTYTATITGQGGFSGVVSLGVSGLPAGATGTFNPTTITGSGSSTLTINTLSSTPAGTSTLTISGVSGSLNHSTTVTPGSNSPSSARSIGDRRIHFDRQNLGQHKRRNAGILDHGGERTVVSVHIVGLGCIGGDDGERRDRRRIDLGAGEANQRAAGRRGDLAGLCSHGAEQCDGDRESVAERGVVNHGGDLHRGRYHRNQWIGGDRGDGRRKRRERCTDSIAGHNPEQFVGVWGRHGLGCAPWPELWAPNQTMVHQFLTNVGSTYWVQRQNSVTPLSGTTVTINDTAPAMTSST